jgi:hypothetical protein
VCARGIDVARSGWLWVRYPRGGDRLHSIHIDLPADAINHAGAGRLPDRRRPMDSPAAFPVTTIAVARRIR